MKKVLLIFGTRPEELKSRPSDFDVSVCVTGQHREMLDQVLRTFGIVPDYDLAVMKPGQTLFGVTCGVMLGIKSVLERELPDVALVHGDTTTSFAAALADALIVLSSKWKDLICDELDIKRSIVHVIPNGVPLGDPSAKPDHDERSCCNILFLGRLEEEKGVGTLIEATGALVRNGAVIELVLAGSGSDEETQRYQLLARREGVNCSFVGWVDSEKKRDLLVEADVFALPSKREVLPISLLEAMGAGVASVASDCGSVPEVIHHGRNGMLCEPGDPESLRTCLALLVQDPVLRKRLAIQGFETVKKGYSVENSVDALLGLYKEVLHG